MLDVLDFIINDCYRADFRITQLTLLCSRFLSLYQQLTVQVEHYPHCSSVSVGIVSDIRTDCVFKIRLIFVAVQKLAPDF